MSVKNKTGGNPAPAEDKTAKGETTAQMLARLGMDGAKWAAEFRTTALRLGYSDMDEGWLLGWFCNAIMAGYDRAPTQPAPDVAALIAERDALRAALTMFPNHYPRGINPFLDDAHNMAQSALLKGATP